MINNKLFTVILAIVISTLMIIIPSDAFAVMFTGSQTASGEWTYNLTYNPLDNYATCESSATITLTGLAGVTSASGPTSTDFAPPGGFVDTVNLAWTPAVLDGGTKVVWTHIGPGTGNFGEDKHVFGFKVFAHAIDGTVNVATNGFEVDQSTSGCLDPKNRDIVATTSGPATPATLAPSTTVTTSSQTRNVIPTTSVTDSATVTGSGTAPLPDLTGTISFQLCGPNPTASTTLNCSPAGTVPITTPNGGTFTIASPAQSPTAAGSYCWTATYTPASGAQYTGSSSTTTDKECFNVLASVTTGRMTGGGSVTDPAGTPTTRVTYGFELHCNIANTPNNLEVNWGNGNKFHLNSLTSVFCVNDPSIVPNPPVAGFDTYVGTGTGSVNGVSGATIEFIFTDAGEPGTNDHGKIKITDSSGTVVVNVSGFLQKGNQQVHNHQVLTISFFHL